MSKLFNFESLVDHELYHLRHGKNALIVAIPRDDIAQSRQQWEQYHESRHKQSLEKIRPIRNKIHDLKRMNKGPANTDEKRQHNDSIAIEIEALQREINSLNYSKPEFFTNLQLAQFYTNNVSRKSETPIRFDKVTRIEEFETHVIVCLDFSDCSRVGHDYHMKIGVADHKRGYRLEGQVKRLLPITHVTLEIVGRVHV